MFQLTGSISIRRGAFLALLLIMLSGNALAQYGPPQPPWGPEVAGNGTYTVNWLRQGSTTYLQERSDATGGAWINVSSSLYQFVGGSTYSVTYTGKPGGDHFYRLRVAYTNQYGTIWSHSNEIRVTVYSGPVPSQDLVSNQVRYSYETRIGDINGDSRQDVYVNRTAGGLDLNGTLSKVILQQNADGSFTHVVPTAGQASTAAGWPASNTLLEIKDLNFDGYVDIRLPNLGSAISGVFGQIIFSSGRVGVAAPQKVTAMGAKYTNFVNDTERWIDQANYFTANASIILIPVYADVLVCDYVWYGDYYSYECWYETHLVGYQQVYDFTPWDPDAVRLRYSISQSTNGEALPTVVPGSTEAGDINRWFRNVFGVDLMRGLLTIGNCTDYDYDSDTRMPCIQVGIHLIQTVHVPSPCRSPTIGEKLETAAENVHVFGIDNMKICNKAYMPAWWPNSLKSDVMAPGDGNVYITPGGFLPWSADYSTALPTQYSVLLHEFVHIFQTRNGGCEESCMFRNKMQSLATGGYKYWPLEQGKPYVDYNIEQQAEMVSDRYRLRLGYQVPSYVNGGAINQGATFETLAVFVPNLQGFMTLH